MAKFRQLLSRSSRSTPSRSRPGGSTHREEQEKRRAATRTTRRFQDLPVGRRKSS